jgi:hypothetical protein
MILCPFCHFQNEDGALFCEQCKSDLSGVPEIPSAEPVGDPYPEEEPIAAVPIDEVPEVFEPEPEVETVPAPRYPAEQPPSAPPFPVMEAVPVEAVPVEAVPVEAVPVPVEPEPVEDEGPVTPWPTPQAPPVAPPPKIEVPPPKVEPPKVEPPKVEPPKVEPLKAAAPTPMPPLVGDETTIPAGAEPRLVVLRGQKRNVEYPVYEGLNFIGRADEKPVDIDLEDQEPPERIWCSRQHALISFEEGRMFLEDLNSANGTYLNRARVYPGQKQPLKVNDVIQIGNVQLKVIV